MPVKWNQSAPLNAAAKSKLPGFAVATEEYFLS